MSRPSSGAVSFTLIFIACTLGASSALADIYTWTDAKGRVNVSNVAPPDGVRVTSVFHEPPPTPEQIEARRDAARAAEVQALQDRVRQLEYEVDSTRRPMMPPMASYMPMPQPPLMPPVMQYPYPSEPAPQPATYAAAPYYNNLNPWCDPMWLTCNNWLGPPLYSTPVVVVRTGNFRRFASAHGSRPSMPPRPMHPTNPPRSKR